MKQVYELELHSLFENEMQQMAPKCSIIFQKFKKKKKGKDEARTYQNWEL